MVSDLTRPEPNFEGTSIVVTARREGGRIRLRLVLGASRTPDAGELRAILTVATMLNAGIQIAKLPEVAEESPVKFPVDHFEKEVRRLFRSGLKAYADALKREEAVRG
jgi:hypothetical protein